MDVEIRDYQPSDRDACLAVFDSNVPAFFHAAERDAYVAFLESPDFLPPRLRDLHAPRGRLYVVEDGGVVVGCGGWYLDGTVANLSWGTIDRSHHGRGFGRLLLVKRLAAIRADGRASTVRVRTTPSVQGFFEAASFKVVRAGTKGLVDEVPLVELVLKLGVAEGA